VQVPVKEGTSGKPVCQLLRGLCGLKHPGRIWNKAWDNFLVEKCHFTRSSEDHGVYYRSGPQHSPLWTLICVDDILWIGTAEVIKEAKRELGQQFPLKDHGAAHYFPGMRIIRKPHERKIILLQDQYIDTVLKRFGFENSYAVSTPMEPSSQLFIPITTKDRKTTHYTSVRYGAGRGRFSLARPRPYTGPGGYVSRNPRPAPVWGPPALIPCTGPRLLPPIFNRDPSGVWVGRGPERGQGQGMPKKTPRPRPFSGAVRGKGPGARVFRDPVRPVTNSTLYRSVLGSLMSLMLCTRPDLAYAVGALSKYSAKPTATHMKAVQRVLRYISKTCNYGLHFGPFNNEAQPIPRVFSDADWAGDRKTRRSTGAYACTLSDHKCNSPDTAITSSSKQQSTIALSSTEAEYMALTQACKQALWVKRFMREIADISGQAKITSPITIFAANQGSMALAKNPEFHSRTKHISIQQHFIREKVEQEEVQLEYLSTGDMLADVLTKALPREKVERFRNQMGVYAI